MNSHSHHGKMSQVIIVILVGMNVALVAFCFTLKHKISLISDKPEPSQQNSETSAPSMTDPLSIPAPGIQASRYPDEAGLIQEIINQLGVFGIDQVLPDPNQPAKVYFSFTTGNGETEIDYYYPASDKTYGPLHVPIVQNGTVNLTNSLAGIPVGDTAYPVDVIAGRLIYAVVKVKDSPDLNDPCESLLLHFRNAPLYSITDSGQIASFTPTTSLLNSATQSQGSCRLRH